MTALTHDPVGDLDHLMGLLDRVESPEDIENIAEGVRDLGDWAVLATPDSLRRGKKNLQLATHQLLAVMLHLVSVLADGDSPKKSERHLEQAAIALEGARANIIVALGKSLY